MFKEIPKLDLDYSLEIGSLNTYNSVKINFLSHKDSGNMLQDNKQQINPELKKETNIVSKAAKSDTLIHKQSFTVSLPDSSSTRVFKEKQPFLTKPGELTQNFLLDIPQKDVFQHFEDILISKPKKNLPVTVKDTTTHAITKKVTGFEGSIRAEASLNWLPGMLLLALFIFSWIKILYQKYIVQVIAATVNYQVSVRLLREKNVLFRNMSMGLNFIFTLNIGLFIYFLIQNFNLNQIEPNGFLSVAIYSLGVLAFYNVKTFICKLIGNVFLVKEQIAEYVHNIHLYNKNTGLFLFPVVIVYPYITSSLIKPIVIYLGLIIIIGMTLLLVYRSFQIIMKNGVSLFYLILYLCAVEILPILLLIKYSFTLI